MPGLLSFRTLPLIIVSLFKGSGFRRGFATSFDDRQFFGFQKNTAPNSAALIGFFWHIDIQDFQKSVHGCLAGSRPWLRGGWGGGILPKHPGPSWPHGVNPGSEHAILGRIHFCPPRSEIKDMKPAWLFRRGSFPPSRVSSAASWDPPDRFPSFWTLDQRGPIVMTHRSPWSHKGWMRNKSDQSASSFSLGGPPAPRPLPNLMLAYPDCVYTLYTNNFFVAPKCV